MVVGIKDLFVFYCFDAAVYGFCCDVGYYYFVEWF